MSKVTQKPRNWAGKLVALFAVATAFAANGAVWYVDAVNGNDGWDGTTAEIPSSGTVGPRQTLVKVMELASAGDTIYAAEGEYKSGEVLADGNATSNRVIVKAGVLLAASGTREQTRIFGAQSNLPGASRGNNTNAVRAVYFATPTAEETAAGFAGGVVKGFSIRRGRTTLGAAIDNNSKSGGGAFGPGLLVDCDFIDNACNYRGGNVAGKATVLRCQMNVATGGSYELFDGCQACDTLFNTTEKVYPSSTTKIVNCTFTNQAAYSCNVYNCLFLDPVKGTSTISQKGSYWNSYSRGAQGNGTANAIADNDGKCRFNLTAEDVPNVELNTRPLSGSEVIDAGNVEYYNAFTNGWKAGWLAHWTGRDYAGNERISGETIDVGCCEWSADELTMHVDAVNGDDGNAGSNALRPKRTLAAAIGAVTDPRLDISLVKAAAGTYAEGSMMSSSKGPARVVIPDGVKLEGAGAGVTFIEGAQATAPLNENGCGVDSLRCAYLANTAILKGFTLRNGYAWYEGTGNYDHTGGGSEGKGLVVDCVYSNNTSCYRGGNVHDGTFVRCYFGPAVADTYNICRYQKMIDCVFDLGSEGRAIYNQDYALFFNCTFITGIPASDASRETKIYNSLILNNVGLSGMCKLFSCLSAGSLGPNSTEGDGYNQFGVDSQRLRIDGTTCRPLRGSLARDKGDGDGTANYRSLITDGWSEAWIAELGDKDFAGGERVLNGRVDVGAGEFIPSGLGFSIIFK